MPIHYTTMVCCVSSLSRVQLCNSTRLLCPWGFSRQEYWRGIKPRSPVLQADSLPSEPPGEPKNTGVSSLPLLQVISLTQELNQALLHSRQILYQLSYERSPLHYYSSHQVCVCAKSLQSCLTLSDPMDCSPPGSSVHGILQARVLEWVAMPSSRVINYNCQQCSC